MPVFWTYGVRGLIALSFLLSCQLNVGDLVFKEVSLLACLNCNSMHKTTVSVQMTKMFTVVSYAT